MGRKNRAETPKKEDKFIHPLDRDNRWISPLLWDILSIASPSGQEELMGPVMPSGALIDKMGNYIYLIGKSKDHQTMFSCHLDTVQNSKLGGQRIVPHISKNGFVFGIPVGEKRSEVLGADDKVGVYIMLRMMEKKIPGIYVFHVGEEVGGKGSEAIAKEKAKMFENVKRAIAFDRKDYNSVITRQRGKECCSKEFAQALADQINGVTKVRFQKYEPDSTGLFTDTANYIHIIPECTNLSVGYFNAHSNSEHFDAYFVEEMLLPALFRVKWNELPTVRSTKDVDAPWERYAHLNRGHTPYTGGYGYGHYGHGYYDYSAVRLRDPVTGEWVPEAEFERRKAIREGNASFDQDRGLNDDLPFAMQTTPKGDTGKNLIVADDANRVIDMSRKLFIESVKRLKLDSPAVEVPIYDAVKHKLLEGVDDQQMILLMERNMERSGRRIAPRWVLELLRENAGLLIANKNVRTLMEKVETQATRLQTELARATAEPVNKKIKKLKKKLKSIEDDMKTLHQRLDNEKAKNKRMGAVMELIVKEKGQEYVSQKFAELDKPNSGSAPSDIVPCM